MRIKINHINHTKNDINVKYNIPFKQINESCKYTLCIVCPACGIQLYGEWQMFNFSDAQVSKSKTLINKFNKCNAECLTDIAEEVLYLSNLKHCPICNGTISSKYIYSPNWVGLPRYFENRPIFKTNNFNHVAENGYVFGEKIETSNVHTHMNLNTADKCYEEIENKIINDTKKKAETLVTDYIYKHSSTSILNKNINNINTSDILKEYILNLINIETNILSISKRLEQLYYYKLCNDKVLVFEENFVFYNTKLETTTKNDQLDTTKKELIELEKQKISFKNIPYPSKPEYPTLKTPHFFNKRKVEAENEQMLREYQNALDKYDADVKKCDAENEKNKINAERNREKEIKALQDKIEKLTKELTTIQDKLNQKSNSKEKTPTKALGEKHLLDSEIKTVEETLKELFECRNELYSYNIIFDKYRNIVALSTFYEYLMAGRCETLDGVNGAYNIYENEIRLNTIITKLDEIKENQFMIYNKLKDIDISLSRLNNTMEKAVSSLDTISKNTSDMNVYLDNISKNTAVIAHNSAVTAYYSKVNAELTNALGFMVALK